MRIGFWQRIENGVFLAGEHGEPRGAVEPYAAQGCRQSRPECTAAIGAEDDLRIVVELDVAALPAFLGADRSHIPDFASAFVTAALAPIPVEPRPTITDAMIATTTITAGTTQVRLPPIAPTCAAAAWRDFSASAPAMLDESAAL